MKTISSIISNNIRSLRAEKGWTQTDLAVASGVSLRGLQDIEGGKRNARPATMAAIAGALDIPEERLYLENQGITKPRQDLTEIKSLLATAAKQLSLETDEYKDRRIDLLESDLAKRDEEIRKLKDQVARLSVGGSGIKTHSTTEEIKAKPEFIEAMRKLIEADYGKKLKTKEEVDALAKAILPKIQYPAKYKKSTG